MTAPLQVDQPRPCFLWVRLVRGASMVGARIWQDKDAFGLTVMRAEINGRPCDAAELWNLHGHRQIDEAEFNFLMADSAHAKAHRPDDPKATPDQPINLLRAPPPF